MGHDLPRSLNLPMPRHLCRALGPHLGQYCPCKVCRLAHLLLCNMMGAVETVVVTPLPKNCCTVVGPMDAACSSRGPGLGSET